MWKQFLLSGAAEQDEASTPFEHYNLPKSEYPRAAFQQKSGAADRVGTPSYCFRNRVDYTLSYLWALPLHR